MVEEKEIETMQTVLYIQQIGDVWTWLIERCGGSVRDSRFRTSFSTSDRAEKVARIWAEVHGLAIDRIDFQPAAPYPTELSAVREQRESFADLSERMKAKVQKLEADLAETKTELAAARKAQTVREGTLTLAERKLDRVRSVLNGDL